MKKLFIATSLITTTLGFISCGGAHGDDTGHAYMPDMYYSRAYEAYGYNNVGGERDSLVRRGITYTSLPVAGTIARGDMLPTHLTGDTIGLKAADALVNPFDTLTKNPSQLKEAERLYLVNCGICHGTALDGNGPLWKNGEGPYPAKPQVLNDASAAKWTDGHIFHVITFGKGQMGSYASQLRPEQRWAVIEYIRSKQAKASTTDSTATPPAASAATGSNPATAQMSVPANKTTGDSSKAKKP